MRARLQAGFHRDGVDRVTVLCMSLNRTVQRSEKMRCDEKSDRHWR